MLNKISVNDEVALAAKKKNISKTLCVRYDKKKWAKNLNKYLEMKARKKNGGKNILWWNDDVLLWLSASLKAQFRLSSNIPLFSHVSKRSKSSIIIMNVWRST